MKKLTILCILWVFIITATACTDIRQPADEASEATLTEIMASSRTTEAETILASMTLEEKVGQMFLGCFYSGTPSAKTVSKYQLGGVLLFGASFSETPKKALTAQLDALDAACTVPPVIAVDEEGGTVARISASSLYRKKTFPSPRKLFKRGGMEAVIANAHEKNALLLSLGIDMNLAPVCDISKTPSDFMYSRSLGQDAETTALYTSEVVSACVEDGIACSLKHFPGYGNADDTHKGIAVDNRSYETLQENDFLPFIAGINAGAQSVLVSHNIVSAIDETLPASLSPAAHRLLREEMEFDGVIITDDLTMGAVSQYTSGMDSAVIAVMAGNDMLCTGHYREQYRAVLDAVNSGLIAEERIDSSVRRILKLKLELGLLPV